MEPDALGNDKFADIVITLCLPPLQHYSNYKAVASIPMHVFLQFFLFLSQTSPGFYVSAVQVFRKHCRKRRNCS